jgi:hemerythrin
MVEWDSKYETGIPAVDDQHKELFKLVGELSQAIDNDGELDCGYLMARLEVYSLYHFTSEEHLMAKYGYPELDEHKKEHKKFRVKILSMKDDCLDDESKEARKDLLQFLETWLTTHTVEIDQKYVPFLKRQ